MKGYYYYSGSAQKNLKQRIERHRRKEKTIRWHIDYLTTHPQVQITNVFVFENAEKKFECELISLLKDKSALTNSIKGFGNSDCKTCDTHLLYGEKLSALSHQLSAIKAESR